MAVEIKKINGVYMGSQEIASTRFAGDANLVYYTRLEGNSNDEKAANNGSDTNITYGTDYGKFGQGGLFNGSTSEITKASPTSALDLTTMSFVVWAKRATSATSATDGFLFSKKGSAANAWPNYELRVGYGADITNGKFDFIYHDGTTFRTLLTDTAVLLDTNWHMIVITYSSGTGNLYFDGNLIKTGSMTGTPITATGQPFYIGRSQDGVYGSGRHWNGSIDEIAFYNDVLTSDEIYSLYKTGVKKLNGQVNLNPELESTSLRGDANLVGYWRFEDNALDETANNNDLTLSGSPSYATGKMGKGLDLELSSSQYAYIADASQTGLDLSTDFTISAWIKLESLPSVVGTAMCIVAKDDASGQRSYHFRILNNDKLNVSWLDSSGNYTDPSSTIAIVTSAELGQWIHVACTADISVPSGIVYKNGVAVSTTTSSTTATSIKNGTAQFRIGDLADAAHNYFDGIVDDVAVFSRALTATEISNLYNTNIKKYNGVSNV